MIRPVLAILFLIGISAVSYSQSNLMRRIPRPGSSSGGKDSLQHRDAFADSITITFRYLDSSRMQKFDSSITDFTTRFPVPWTHFHLGNVGTATHSMVFQTPLKSGWDPGFHAYDVYNYNDYETRFYNTTRPYSELNYQLGSRAEQIIRFLHTQNIMPNWNAAFEYRLVTSPGFFQNQASNNNNYRFSSWYQSKNKRYQNFFLVVGNKLESGNNGGIDESYLDSTSGFYNERSTIPTRLGPNESFSRNPFSVVIPTGTFYTNASYMLRQQYDLGQKDSIVTDSTVIPLFYPRLRLEHTINYRTYNYRFSDSQTDSAYYKDIYSINLRQDSSYFIRDHWRELLNDFSIYQFPDAKNSQQFFRAGATLQNLTSTFDTAGPTKKFHNFFLHGEYRNKTRNKKWDIEANGNFYVNGLNAGDYNAQISLRRLISRNLGYLQVGFANVNRTPSFNYDSASSFYKGSYKNFKKENNTELFGSIEVPRLQLKLTGTYTLLSNYTYYNGLAQADQYSTLFNVLRLTAQKQFNFGRGWNWRTWLIIQKIAGNAPVNLPLILTRNQIGYDGKLGFKNLLISFGLELRYYQAYKADVYSPLTGQFAYQDTQQVKLKFPETAGYLNFRIKTFTAYVRAENLNSFSFAKANFTDNNVVSPGYAYPGLQIRVGIYWSFIN